MVATTGSISRAKLQSNHYCQQTSTKFILQAGCPSCHPTNSVKALKGKRGSSLTQSNLWRNRPVRQNPKVTVVVVVLINKSVVCTINFLKNHSSNGCCCCSASSEWRVLTTTVSKHSNSYCMLSLSLLFAGT